MPVFGVRGLIPLDLHSEKFARTGNIAGEGFKRLMGRPALGLLQTAIREALQNSVDAAPRGNPVKIQLRFRVLKADELANLRAFFFRSLPPDEAYPSAADEDSTSLRQILQQDELSVLEIADFNTRGLAGPTRADIASTGDRQDFVNFLRNIGAGRDTYHGGGTYGYGKTSLYALSKVSTIIADTQTTCDGAPVRRVMGCHLGKAYNDRVAGTPRRFTGRHWWGRNDLEGGVDPLEGAEATELADLLGFPKRDARRTGTTITIIAPHVDPDVDLRADLVETVLWNFWPRMCASTPAERRIEVSLEFKGQDVEIPRPENYPPLDLYAAALQNVRGTGAGEVTSISSAKPSATLGRLSIVKGLRATRKVTALREGSPMREQAHAIALMRPVELVVRYLEGTAFADDRFEWAGVFICSDDEEIEKAFAVSEPPAHDDWVPHILPRGRAKTFVRVALRELKEIAATYVQPKSAIGTSETKGPSVAKVAARLGQLLSRTSGKGPSRPTSSRSGDTRKKIAISAPRFVGLEHVEGRRVARFEAELTNDGSRPRLVLHASPHLVLDGSAASSDDLPDHIAAELIDLSLGGVVGGPDGVAIGSWRGKVSCRATVPDDAAVGIQFDFREEGTP